MSEILYPFTCCSLGGSFGRIQWNNQMRYKVLILETGRMQEDTQHGRVMFWGFWPFRARG